MASSVGTDFSPHMHTIDQTLAVLRGLGWPLVRVATGKNKNPITAQGYAAEWRDERAHIKCNLKNLKVARRGDDFIIGVLFPPEIVVLDFDSADALPRINKATGGKGYDLREFTLAVQSGRGHHLYFELPKKRGAIRAYKNVHPLFDDVDVRFNGMMVVPPSLHWEKKHHYTFVANGHDKPHPMPKPLRRLFKRVAAETLTNERGPGDSSDMDEPPDGEPFITPDQLRTALDALPVSLYQSRIDYLRIISSIHHGTRGAGWALDMVLEWSSDDPDYATEKCQAENVRMWKSLKR